MERSNFVASALLTAAIFAEHNLINTDTTCMIHVFSTTTGRYALQATVDGVSAFIERTTRD